MKRQERIVVYDLTPSLCKECDIAIPYAKRKNKFCCSSCAAKYTNAKKDWSKITTGPTKGSVPKWYVPKTLVKICAICGKYHPGGGNTCSKECFSKYVSLQVRGKTGGNRDVNMPGTDSDGNHFYYDSGWEISLAKSLNINGVRWQRPKRFILSDGRSYTPDFYLPDYDVFLDPKAKRPGHYRTSLLKIEMFEQEYGKSCLVISNKKWLNWGQVQTMLLVGNNRA
jgi:hypothetical protein